MKQVFLKYLPVLFSVLVAGSGFFTGCLPHGEVAGGGVQTTNGDAFYPDGEPAEGAMVFVRLETYLADTVPLESPEDFPNLVNSLTDSSGHYEIDPLEAGNYMIEVNDGNGRSAVGKFRVEHDDEIIDIDTLYLEATGKIIGSIDLPQGEYQVWAQIYGLERIAIADEEGNFEIELPEGEYQVQTVFDSEILEPAAETITVSSDDTVQLEMESYDFSAEDFSAWTYSMDILFNTSDSGADIESDVMNFPMLIRLDSNNFDFTESHPEGDDIRFTDSEGAPLKFEIEQWSAPNRNAQLWVLLDRVRAASHSQTITLIWGKSEVPSSSKSSDVFKASDGYKGVWHLGSENGQGPDASDNENTGEFFGNLPTTTTGLIGPSQFFDGKIDVIETRNIAPVTPVQALTVTAWFKHLSVQNNRIASRHNDKVDGGEFGWFVGIDFNGGGIEFDYSSDGFDWNKTYSKDSGLAVNSWHHVAVVYNGSSSSIYIAGVPSNPGDTSVSWDRGINMPPRPITIGMTHNRTYPLEGHIDEVRVSGVARSPDWIKLSYESQRDSSLLFTFNP